MRHVTRRQAVRLMTAAGLACLTGCQPRLRPKAGRGPVPPMPQEVNGCTLDDGRLDLLRSCTESCGPDDEGDEWDHACLHPHTVVYSCGRPARFGGPNEHDHPPGELDRCRKLAAEAADLLKGLEAVGSEGGAPYAGFYLIANRTDPVPDAITPDVVRRLFGDVIYPPAEIKVEPLEERGDWWRSVLSYYGLHPDGTHPDPQVKAEREASFHQWRALVRWFKDRKELTAASYVAIGEDPLSETNFGCNFPRLHIGLTKAGSLVGTCTVVVHT
jgi:hypothetical protein